MAMHVFLCFDPRDNGEETIVCSFTHSSAHK
jgi:hypothetical protein